jgi:hypothetical protein
MTFIKNNYFKILLALTVLIGLPYWFYQTKTYNSTSSKLFFESNVDGIIKNLRDGSGGFDIITLDNGHEYRFFSQAANGKDFDDEVKIGDRIHKLAGVDTITIYTSSQKELKYTFLKP